MGESLINYCGAQQFPGYSAGSSPKGMAHPLTLELLTDMQLPIDGLRSKSWIEFAAPGARPLDFVFTVCDDAAREVHPNWPGEPVRAHWGVDEPAAVNFTDVEMWSAATRRCRGNSRSRLHRTPSLWWQTSHGVYDAERYAFAAAYGVGPQYVVLDRDSGKAVESGFKHRPQILRDSGAPVDLAPFLHAAFAHVTGTLVSAADAANYPAPLGLDFMLLPNPNAAPGYTAGQLSIGRKWRLAPAGDGQQRRGGHLSTRLVRPKTGARFTRIPPPAK